MKATSSTKEQLLQAAIELMLAKGFTATTVDEICEKARVTKGGFFYYFDSKEDLGKAALEQFWQRQMQMFQQQSFDTIKDPLRRLHKFLDFFITATRDPRVPKSCLLGNFTQELAVTHPAIRTICEEKFSNFADIIKPILDEIKAKYALGTSFDTQSLAEYFLALFQGTLILVKAKQDTGVIEENIQHFKRYLETLIKKNRRPTLKSRISQ